MQKAKYVVSGSFLLTLIIFGTVVPANAEEVKVTSYYPSPNGVYKNLQVLNSDESQTLSDFTQGLIKAGLNIATDYSAGTYTPGIFWSTTNNNPLKPKAGIWMHENAAGSELYLGTSNNYVAGITNNGLVLDKEGRVGIGANTVQNAQLQVQEGGINNIVLRFVAANGLSFWDYDMLPWSGAPGGTAMCISPTTAPIFCVTDAGSDAQVTVGAATPYSSAAFGIYSTKKGFMPPHLASTGSVVGGPQAGLIIYDDSDNQMKYYNGTVWVPMGGGAVGHVGAPYWDSGWLLFNGSPDLVITHNKNIPPDQQLIDLEFSPAVQTNYPGINHFASVSYTLGSQESSSWINKTSNSISVRSNVFSATHQKRVRIRMWVVD